MSSESPLEAATEALDACDVALVKLEKTCCMPERGPRMEALANSLTEIRGTLKEGMASDEGAAQTVTIMEEVGAQVGHLQVTCCAPSRSRHYATILAGLTDTQRSLASARGQAH
jgi:hypothetical protein